MTLKHYGERVFHACRDGIAATRQSSVKQCTRALPKLFPKSRFSANNEHACVQAYFLLMMILTSSPAQRPHNVRWAGLEQLVTSIGCATITYVAICNNTVARLEQFGSNSYSFFFQYRSTARFSEQDASIVPSGAAAHDAC